MADKVKTTNKPHVTTFRARARRVKVTLNPAPVVIRSTQEQRDWFDEQFEKMKYDDFWFV